MLRADNVEDQLSPVSESQPSGPNLEYDPAFLALESLARPVAEQQFGDTVIAAQEPNWSAIAEQAQELLGRSKDLRIAMLALRAATRLQGLAGLSAGLRLLQGLLETFWSTLHPQLDADDHDDPTMRINALAPLVDLDMVLRDVLQARLGAGRAGATLQVRDIAIAYNRLAPAHGESPMSPAQVEGSLKELLAQQPEQQACALAGPDQVQALQRLVAEQTGRPELLDLRPLHDLLTLVRQVCQTAIGIGSVQVISTDSAQPEIGSANPAGAGVATGDIRSRADALQQLDRVIDFLQRTEPGNPAPLLIQRAKRLVGVSFLDIMADLAPDALQSIENITGRPPSDAG